MPAMSAHEWLDLALRWAHLIAGIAWIGSSFYFIWLDSHLERAEQGASGSPGDPDLEGSLWMVHSGGFYRVERRRVGPGRMPRTLHWFKWEAAITWLSGVALLGLVYYSTRGLYLLDPAVSRLGPGAAIGLGLGSLVLGWLVYDALWTWAKGRREPVALAVSLAWLVGGVLGLCATLSGRAAFLHVGAILGTIMTANVWLRILPAQQRMIDATARGEMPDFTLGEAAKRRSVHNSYLTFPVLFAMLSNHFPGAYGGPWRAAILLLLVVIGMGVRHLMIGKGKRRGWTLAPLGASAVLVVLLASPASWRSAVARAVEAPGRGVAPERAQVEAILLSRCVACHATEPRIATFGAAPGGVNFEDPAALRRYAKRIRARVVETQTMPLGNMTLMTREERLVLARWIDAGQP